MIINPMFFYLMHVSGGMRVVLFVISAILLVIAAVLGFIVMVFIIDNIDYLDDEDDDDVKKLRKLIKFAKMLLFSGLVSLAIGICIPNKDTILLMQAAKLVTTDNVNAMFEALKAAMDYAITILK